MFYLATQNSAALIGKIKAQKTDTHQNHIKHTPVITEFAYLYHIEVFF